MTQASLPKTEQERLETLAHLEILDTLNDPTFDNLTQIAANLFDVPISIVSLVDADRAWFKSSVGLNITQLPRKGSFCCRAITADQLLVIEDTLQDSESTSSPLVTDAPFIRFYAGAPIRAENGLMLGTLCLLDYKPRHLTPKDQHRLTLLARQVEQLIHLHYRTIQLAHLSKARITTNARYEAIIEGAAAGIIRIDGRGSMLQVNNSALHMLGYERDELLGQNVKMLMPARWGDHHDGYLSAYQATGNKTIIGTGREVAALHKNGSTIPVHLAVSEVQYGHAQAAPEAREFIGILSDLRAVVAAREREAQERALLQVLHRGLTDYRALLSGNTLWGFLQEALQELTGSDYALIGEVIPKNGKSALKIHAISDLSWNEASRKLMEELRSGQMLLTGPNTMLGQVFTQGKMVLSNNMETDARGGNLPPGHPPLYRYLGVPIIDRGELIGMYAIANGKKDYDEALVQWLEPFTSTCALLINLYRQLSEQQRFTEELKVAKDSAELSSQAKTDFLSSMSHELRTPLNAILGFAQLLANGRQPLSERQQRQVDQILRSGRHLLNLINEVLDLARIESGHTQVSLEPIKLQELIDETAEIIRPLALEQQLQLDIIVDKTHTYFVQADYTRLKQILINLLSNAVKYNKPNGSITLSCVAIDGLMRFSIQDTGIGIAADLLDSLFEPFNRLGAETGSIEGTGVGLALTRKLARLMNSDVYVKSNPNEGSLFWFDLPITSVCSNPTIDTTETTILSVPAADSHQYKILYIEDNPENQRLMQDLCSEITGVHLQCVYSAEIGFEVACSDPPDLILMDIDLPGMNGFQAQRMLKQNPLTSATPVLAISASSAPQDIKCAEEAGFIGFYIKPFNLDKMTQHLKKILTQKDHS